MKDQRVLLVVTPSVSETELAHEVPSDELHGAELRIVVPAVAKSAISYWFSDEGGMEHAREAAEVAGRTAGAEAASVHFDAGDADPVLAVQDALAQFPADRVILVHRADRAGYREGNLDHLAEKIRQPVEDRLVAA
jgi:hypothetical protein